MTLFTTDLADGVAVVTLDVPGESVNVLSREVRQEFSGLLERLGTDGDIRAVVLTSGKPDVFIAGADIEELRGVASAAAAEQLSREGHRLLDRLENLRVPVVAAIQGACLGGGLEVALACSYRVAAEHPKTSLGLPEVQLGLIPGAGGTQRLPRLVGLRAALDMILAGRSVRPKRALAMGLVDEVVHPAILLGIARERALKLAEKDGNGRGRRRSADRMLLDENPLGRAVVIRKAREAAEKKSGGHYPAPLAALEAVARGYADGPVRGGQEESRLFGEMAMTPEARELTFLFRATTDLKKDPGVDMGAVEPPPVQVMGVIGAGFMGAGIATVAAQNGVFVRLRDADHAGVTRGLAAIREVLVDRVRRRRMSRRELEATMGLVAGTVDYTGFRRAELVVEAVFEELELKQAVLREAEAVLDEEAVYASNTSTIPIDRIAAAARAPERVCGMHFFSPVHRMPLLEVVRGAATDDVTIVRAVAAGKKLGKTVIVVNDGPGFYTTRILAAFLNEAGHLLDAGARIDALDHALVSFGFPVGPITLVDEVGLDVAGRVTQVLGEAFGNRIRPPDTLKAVVADGRTGRKGRKGFYEYDSKGNKGGVDSSVYELFPRSDEVEFPVDEIQQRTVMAMVNEAARCMEEGILRSPRDGDVGAVFGLGFPPFLGGPFRWMDALGAGEVVDRLESLQDRFGTRFAPADELLTMAARDDRWHRE